MEAFVLVALAFAVLSLAGVGVAAMALLRAGKALKVARLDAEKKISPLAEELAAEQAVTALELDALRRARTAPSARRGHSRDVH